MIQQYGPTRASSKSQYLAPADARLADFNYLLGQFDQTIFRERDGDRSVIIFKPSNSLAEGRAGQQREAVFTHTIFVARNNKAFQLELSKSEDTSLQFFSVACRGHQGEFTAQVARDFTKVTISDRSGHTSIFDQVSVGHCRTTPLEYQPLPPVPRVLVYHESLKHVCFVFERVGAYPTLLDATPSGIGIRGFRETNDSWREFEVMSTILAGRGLHNLTINTEIGEFFIPSPSSIGSASYTNQRGESLIIRDFDLDPQQDPKCEQYEWRVGIVLRSLGLPLEWPPSELGIPGL